KVGRKQPGDIDQRQRGGFEMAGTKGLVHGSILLCRREMAAGERSIWRAMLCAEAENIEQADAVSAASSGASKGGGRCF
ncbi:MAG: hypothetical protein KKC57_26665, partial [Alphaproteobacteria bacterium]|nr:hypothetical protein [Alphaproteobacteria bacterium]